MRRGRWTRVNRNRWKQRLPMIPSAELEQETHVSEAAGEPSGRDVKTLFAKIDALPAQKSRSSIDLGARFADFLASLSPRTLAWSAMAAALVLVLQAGIL